MTSDEVSELAPIYAEYGASLPLPGTATFVGAFKNGRRVGFICLQAKLHAEPMHITEGHSDVFVSLVKAAEQLILSKVGPQWVYAFTPAGRVTQLAHTMGMRMEPYVVMSKLVQPEIPPEPVVDLGSLPLGEVPEDDVVQ